MGFNQLTCFCCAANMLLTVALPLLLQFFPYKKCGLRACAHVHRKYTEFHDSPCE